MSKKNKAKAGDDPHTEQNLPPTEHVDAARDTAGAAWDDDPDNDGGDISQEDREFINEAAEQVMEDPGATEPPLATARDIWSFAVFMAADRLIDTYGNADIAKCLAVFYLANPDAPANAAGIEVRLRLGVDLLPPSVAPERLDLAVKIFKTALLGRDRLEKAQASQEATPGEPGAPRIAPGRSPDDLAFQPDKGRLEPSDLGKSLLARGT